MEEPTVWQSPGPQRRERPILDRIDAVKARDGAWAQIATYGSRGSATAVMSRIRRRMGGNPCLRLATRALPDGRIGLFACWTSTEAGLS